ncbi:MAG TPA: hypothetical protein PKW15_07180 [Alphaproteobacteria bacterium]|nr:hypothetical protein [Rhodospirillaceae bacterium]HRJ13007.1 hypothetical protein [Alphaproteobacteria bacterium]
MMKKILFALAMIAIAAPAMAQTWPQPDDSITVQLSAEDYVTATSGKVTLSVDAALKDSDAANTRKEIMAGAQKIAKTSWRMVNFNNSTDQTGLTRWNALLEARLPEAQLTGLTAAAKAASRPGLQFTVSGTDMSPTLDEMEAGRAKLRAVLLTKANEELARVNKNAGGRTYRIADIQYGSFGMPMPMPMVRGKAARMEMMAMDSVASSAPGSAGGASFSVDQKIEMTATVSFATATK